MADTVIARTSMTGINPSAQRASVAATYSGTLVANDTDYHIFRVPNSGKGKFTYCVDNPSDKDCTVFLYGSFDEDAEITESTVFAIDSTGIIALAGSEIYDVCADGFPWIFLRLKFAATPDGSTVSVYTYCIKG